MKRRGGESKRTTDLSLWASLDWQPNSVESSQGGDGEGRNEQTNFGMHDLAGALQGTLRADVMSRLG